MRITTLEEMPTYFRTREVAHLTFDSWQTEHVWGSTSKTYQAACGLRKNASTWLHLYEELPEGVQLCKTCVRVAGI